MAYDESLAVRIRSSLVNSSDVSEKRMFGGLCFLKHGHMFVGIVGNELMARVGKEAYASSLSREHVREMDFTGRPMAGYVFVSPPGLTKQSQLEFWLRHCEQHASTLPPKLPKPAPARKRRARAT